MDQTPLKKRIARLAMASAVALFVAPVAGNAQGPDWAFDFRMTDSATVDDASTTRVTTGLAVVSKGRVRLDMKGSSRIMPMPQTGPGEQASMIVEANGKLIMYLMPKTREYMQLNPVEFVKQMQKMMQDVRSAMKFDISGPDPKLENLGKGPVILGHQTVHYRLTTAIKTSMTMMGEHETIEMKSTTDQYFAPDLREIMDPFSVMKSLSEMSGMSSIANKAYIDKMWAVQSKLPRALELRTVEHASMSRAGFESDFKTIREVTSIKRITAGGDLFVVPAGYKKLDIPGAMTPATR
jgi:hypothetical protein